MIALDRLASDRAGMTKSERCTAVYAVLRHYTHQAHHGPSEGGESSYTRSDAQFVFESNGRRDVPCLATLAAIPALSILVVRFDFIKNLTATHFPGS